MTVSNARSSVVIKYYLNWLKYEYLIKTITYTPEDPLVAHQSDQTSQTYLAWYLLDDVLVLVSVEWFEHSLPPEIRHSGVLPVAVCQEAFRDWQLGLEIAF